MSKQLHYIISPLFYLGVMVVGRTFTGQGLTEWYPSITKPSYTPPGSFIGIVWTIIFVLSAISLILFINRGRESKAFWLIIGVFIFNGIVNTAWSYIFFTRHMIGLAVIDSLLILITVGLLMVLTWPYSKASSILLLPYLLWVSFATYLTYVIYVMN